MTVTITVREQSQTATGFDVTLVIAGTNYQATVSDPFTPKQERELEWYFESWLRFPTLENVKAERAKASVRQYGEDLFQQLFADQEAYAQYKELLKDFDTELEIAIESLTPEFHAIHWEALQDPNLPRPLAINSVLIRKTVNPVAIPAQVKPSPTINLLVVTARPNGANDVGYRTISRPLVEAVRNAKLRVKIDILRPGTYEALSRHLDAKGKGYYHIVHFDVHGALKTYENFQEGAEHNRYLYEGRYGRGKIEAYEGLKAFLALEGKETGEYDLVEAGEMADLLTGKGIPVCILNACQSGKQIRSPLASPDNGGNGNEDNRETSLGSRLMNAGMQMVVAMSYSVTVTAAEIIMQQIYQYLFEQQDLNRAILEGRRELHNRKERQAYYNTEIELEDWLLPVVYSHGEVDFNLREFTLEEEEAYYESLDSKYQFPEPTYGFVGRDIDILGIEKALLQHNILLLQGMGGTGKTTLLNYLREWWQVTNFARDIFYFGYDEKAYNLQQIVHQISQQVYSRAEMAKSQAQSLTAQWRKLAQKLRTEPYILILDNLESVTGQQLAIQNTLDEPAREEIRKFLADLSDGKTKGKTKVILGSRIAEEWLQASTFKDNHYRLRGLDIQARTNLAKNIIAKINSSQTIESLKANDAFKKIMKLLAGYPLAMEVILSNLKYQTPATILAQLEQAEIDAGGGDKTNNIIKCIEYSHSNLSPASQKLLLLLAPFRRFIDRNDLKHYQEQLAKLKAFQDYDLANLTNAVDEAVTWGLLSPLSKDIPHLLTIQPVLPYFLQTKLKAADEPTKIAIETGFKNHYQGLAGYYTKMMQSKEAQERQLGITFVSWEYENLYQALQLCLIKKEKVYTIWYCLYIYLDLTSNRDEQLRLTESLNAKLSQYTPENIYEGWERDIIPISGNLANSYQKAQNYQKAKEMHLDIINLVFKFNNIEENQKKSYLATANHQLGHVAQQLREYPQARDYYQQALDIKIEYGDRFSQASTLHELGRVAEELREYPQARDYYQQALDIWVEYGDRFSQASTLHQLGRVAQELREYPQARDYYQQALDIKIEFGDRFSQASTLHQLGRVAQELRELEQARDYYQQALDILIEYGDRYEQAGTLHQLGIVAQELREYPQARDYYQQALDIKIEYGDRFSQARTLHHLGIVAQELREYPQARDYYQQALDIKIEYGDRFSQASTLHQLGRVAEELREYPQARDYYQQALDILIEYGDRYEQAGTLHHLGMVAEELREYPQARDYYQQALDLKIEYGDRFSQARTLHHLGIVAQELREYPQARDYYQQALDIKIEFGDRFSQARTLHHLGIVAQELREYPQARDYYQQALDLKIEYGDRFSQASTYFQLGKVAEELAELEQAKNYYFKDLELTLESNDEQGIAITLRNLARFYQKTEDYDLIVEVAKVFKTTEEEVKESFDKFNAD